MFVCLGFGHFILFVYFFPWAQSLFVYFLGREASLGASIILFVYFIPWLGFGILFYLFIFFLGREAQKVREWGVNSLKTSIFPLPTPLRGCMSLLEIVFCRTV